MKSPCIVHLRPSNFVGGPEQQLLRYAEAERHGPIQVYLGTFVGARAGVEFLQAATSRKLRAFALPFGPWSALPALVRELRSRHVDLLCTHGYKADILGLIAGRLLGIPVVYFLRGWTAENRKIVLYEALDRVFLRFADRIVCLSEDQVQRVTKLGYSASRIHTIPNAIDVPSYSPEQVSTSRRHLRELYEIPQDCPVVASAGRLSPEKGVGVFIDAAAELSRRYPSVHFLIFGDGALRSHLELKTRELGLVNCFRFAGFVPQLRELLPGVDILVNPSFSEEMPNIVLEAMAARIPVVATSVGGLCEIAGSEQALSLVSPGNLSELIEAVSAILYNREYAIRLAERGRARVCRSYSVVRQRAQLRSLYRDILSADQLELPAADFCELGPDSSRTPLQNPGTRRCTATVTWTVE